MDGLTSPFELLELQDGESVNFRAERYEKAETTIVPKHLPTGKRVTALRVHIRHEDKPTFPYYWDLTASTLVAQIEPHLRREDLARLRFTITARGIGPKKRFSVDVAPAL